MTSEKAREEIILAHLDNANRISRRVLIGALKNTQHEDARQEALLALCKAVDTFEEGRLKNGGISEYVGSKMFYAVTDFARQLPFVGNTRKSKKQAYLVRVWAVPSKKHGGTIDPLYELKVEPNHTPMYAWALEKAAARFSARNVAIFREWCEDTGTTEIAKRYGVTSGRIKQIVDAITKHLKTLSCQLPN